MTIQALQAFKTAAEEGSFTRAAEKLYMTQPAFSRLMSAFEQEMGGPLFDRVNRKVILNARGEVCLRHVNEMLNAYDALLSEMHSTHMYPKESLKVGYNPVSGPPEFLLSALRKLSEAMPQVNVTLQRAYSEELVQMTEEKVLDCAYVSLAYVGAANVESMKIEPIFFYALLPSSHPLAERETLSIRDLEGIPLLFMKESAPCTRKTVLRAFREQGMEAVEAEAAYDLEEMVMRVRLGGVVGISSFCDRHQAYPDLVSRRISEFGTVKTEGWRG